MGASLPQTIFSFPRFISNCVYELGEFTVRVPEQPLADRSLQIQKQEPFVNWTQEDHKKSYKLFQKIVRIWNKENIHDYLIFSKIGLENEDTTPFTWEIVPYSTTATRLGQVWQQFQVLWKITFGGSRLFPDEQEKYVQTYTQSFSEHTIQANSPREEEVSSDAFCNPQIIDKQRIFKGKTITVLYNYAPIGWSQEKLDFLLITNKHRNFDTLEEEEYAEAMQLCKKIITYYREKMQKIAYIFLKEGEYAGENVDHTHIHLIILANRTEDWWGKGTVLKNMLIGPSILPDSDLENRVNTLRKQLEPILNKQE